MLRRLSLTLLCIISCAVQAESFDISLSDDTAQIKYLYDAAQLGIGGADRGFGIFFNENDDFLASFEFLVTGSVVGTNRSLQLGAGFKAYAGSLDTATNDKAIAAAIGGKLNYILPSKLPMSLYMELYLAPDVTSFGDIEKFIEFGAGYELEVAPSTRLYIGYRKMEAELSPTGLDYEIEDSGHLGIRVTF